MRRIKKIAICLTIAVAFLFADIVTPLTTNPFAVEVSAAQQVKLNKKKVTLYRKQSVTLKLKGTSKKVTWSSSNKSVAKVTSKGKVTALKKGTATITAKSGGKKYTCKVTVKNPTLSNKKVSIKVGNKKTLTVKNAVGKVKWSSSNKAIASVSKKGVVTGKKAGTATITAKASGVKLTCKVKVKNVAVSSVSLDQTSAKLTEGETLTLKATVTPSTATNKKVTWTTSDNTIAAVSSAGVVTAKKAGTATITAKAGNKTAACSITVAEKAAPSKETYTLTVASHDTSTSMCELYLEALCSKISEESGGRLQFEFYPDASLLSSLDAVEGVKKGTADICWSSNLYNYGRFPVSEFITLPGNGLTSARFATDVFQQMYEEIPEVQNEFSDWKVIALHGSDYAPVCSLEKIESPEDLKMKNIRGSGAMQTMYLSSLDLSVFVCPFPDVYEVLEKRILDVVISPYSTIESYKWYEPLNYCLDFPVSVSACFVLMNKDVYDSMDAELQTIIDKYANGYAGDMAGYWWDSCKYRVEDKMKENGIEISKPSEEFTAWATSDDILSTTHASFIQNLNAAGYDGQALYNKCMEIVSRNAAGHADDWAAPFNYTDWSKTPEEYQQ